MAGNKQKMRYFTRLRYMKVRYKDRQAVDKKKKQKDRHFGLNQDKPALRAGQYVENNT